MTRPRRFSIRDGMLLVAASAVVLAVIAFVLREQPFRASRPRHFLAWSDWIVAGPPRPLAFVAGVVLLAAWLAQRPRRPRLLLTRPGFVAALAATAAAGLGLAAEIALALAQERAPLYVRTRSPADYFAAAASRAPAAVLGAWLALLLSGRWRPRPDRRDRLGRLLGGYWLLPFPFEVVDGLLVLLDRYS